jgi:hypothetical protein
LAHKPGVTKRQSNESYTNQSEEHNGIAADDFVSAANRYARRLSRQLGFPVALVRTALVANAAVKEH